MLKKISRCLVLIFFSMGISRAQVVSPNEINDPALRSLQVQFSYELNKVGIEILATKFPYPFYLSRKLDLDKEQQEGADQHSIRFDRYGEQIVLAISGNYYAAYSGGRVSPDRRALQSFTNVVLPILRAAVPRFQSNESVRGYAVEISHHVIGTAMGVTVEQPENLMVFLPQSDAVKLVGSKERGVQQSALLNSKIFLNGEPLDLWLDGDNPPPVVAAAKADRGADDRSPADLRNMKQSQATAPGANGPKNVPKDDSLPAPPARDTSPAALSTLQSSKQEMIGKLLKELAPQANFVTYAVPSFVAFRNGTYLELSLNTILPVGTSGSRYKIAALAFDDHIAHLLRPALTYFKNDADFDGVGFSTTVKVASKTKLAGPSEAVEFFFPFPLLRCYEKYDCTGQQLIDGGTVLINGERVSLDLQSAEANIR